MFLKNYLIYNRSRITLMSNVQQKVFAGVQRVKEEDLEVTG